MIGEFQRFHADIYGNRDFIAVPLNQHKFFCAEEDRELDMQLALMKIRPKISTVL